MFDLQLLPSRELFKFNRQLPLFNWYYPFSTDEGWLPNPLLPLMMMDTLPIRRCAVYLHIPFCETICSFCPFTRGKYKTETEVQDYVTALLREIEFKRRFIGRRKVDVIFVGGGTPSVLSPSQIEVLGASIHTNFDTQSVQEFTFEVEVKSVTREKLEAMRNIGVNRISFGVQTFSDLHRRMFSLDATVQQIRDVADLVNDMFDYTNVDMIYGMAGQSLDALYRDAREALALRTTTVDFYPLNNLAVQIRMYKRIRAADLRHLPATERVKYRLRLDEFLRAQRYAPINGYSYSLAVRSQRQVVQHSPKFKYHDIVYGYHDDAIIGYGSSSLTQLPGYNLYNSSDRLEYMAGLLDKGFPPYEAFRIPSCPERGVVSFPYRGVLERSKIAWESLPPETVAAFDEAIEAGLVVDRGATYELSDSGWLFYVNLMYYLIPNRGKQWITHWIAAQIEQGHECEQTELNEEGIVNLMM